MEDRRRLFWIGAIALFLLAPLAFAQESPKPRKTPSMTDDDLPVRKADPPMAPINEAPNKPGLPSTAPAGNFASVWTVAFAKLKALKSFRVSKVVNASRARDLEQAEFTLYPPDGVVGDDGRNAVIVAGLISYTVFDRDYDQTTIDPARNRCIQFFEDYPTPAEVRAATRLAPDGGGVYEGTVQRSYGAALVRLRISTVNKLTGSAGGMLDGIEESPVGEYYPHTFYHFSDFNKDPFDPTYRINDMKRDRVPR